MKRIIKSLFLILFTFVLVGCINKDKTKPTITGHKNWTIIVGEEEPDYLVDVSASDDVDGELTVKIKSKNVIKEIIGEYQVILSAVDSSGNEATVNLAVYVDPVPVVKDEVAPVITGYKDWTIFEGKTEPNYLGNVTANDDVDGKVDVTIKSNNVNKNVPGEYKVVISATDLSGNEANATIKVVIVKDVLPPVISGHKNWEIIIGEEEPNYLSGVYANDEANGYVSVTITFNNVNRWQYGDYEVVLSASDLKGNVSDVTIVVKVIPDTEAPVITGYKDWTINAGESEPYYLEDIKVTDNHDEYPYYYILLNNVNNKKGGEYEVEIKAGDSSGNTSIVRFKVTVLPDITPPEIRGSLSETYYVGTNPYFLWTINGWDEVDGYITPTIKSSNVDMSKAGDYEILVSAIDNAGNETTATLNIKVIEDTVAPIIYDYQNWVVYKGKQEPNYLYRVYAWDEVNGYTDVVIKSSNVNMNEAGEYEIVLSSADKSGNVANVTIKVDIILDTVAPKIDNYHNMTIFKGKQEPNYLNFVYAWDEVDGYTDIVIESSTVNTNQVGLYEVVLSSTDESGNVATVTFTVEIILDTEAPVISYYGNLKILVGNPVPDYAKWASCNDNADGYVPVSVKSSNVDNTVPGDYTMVLSAVDSSGNEGTLSITVKVYIDTTPPEFLGYKDITIETGNYNYDFTYGIVVFDDTNGIIKDITVDKSKVNFDKPGVYEVTLSAKDKSGNEATVTIAVTVRYATPDLGGYTIRIAHANPAEVDPFHAEYIASDKEAKKQAWDEVERYYNVRIQVEQYDPSYPWGQLRWDYIIDYATKSTSEYDFVSIPDDKIPLLAESSVIYDTSYWYSEFGNGFLADVYKTSGTYQKKLYSITDADPMINNVMYYNVNLVNDLIRSGHLDKTPAEIFNEGKWTYSAFRDYAIKAQKGLDIHFSNDLYDVYAVSGYATYYLIGMVDTSGMGMVDVENFTVNINDTVPQKAAEALKAISEAGAMRPTRTSDGLSNANSANSFTKGRGIFDTGDLWFVGNEKRWPSDMWSQGTYEESNYGYVPFPRPDGDEFTKENQTIGLGGITTFAMPIGREHAYAGFGETSAENVYRAFINTFLLTEEYLYNDPYYDRDIYLSDFADRVTGSQDSKEAMLYILKNLNTKIIFDPMSIPANNIVNTWSHQFGKQFHIYIVGSPGAPATYTDAIMPYIMEIQEKLRKAYS